MYALKTKRFWRGQLPHWEVESGVYFFTIRCTGTLPREVVAQLKEISAALAAVEPSSDAFLQWQRRYFQTVEKYDDQGRGFCPFHSESCARLVIKELSELSKQVWFVRDYVVMPNHLHFLVETYPGSGAMAEVWSEWKGRTAFRLNKILGRKGRFWQREFFDRVSRSEVETQRMIRYIRENPVKARLAGECRDYPWVGNLKECGC